VRELKNRIERAVLITSGTTLDLDGLCDEEAVHGQMKISEEPLPFSLRDMEKNMIFKALGRRTGTGPMQPNYWEVRLSGRSEIKTPGVTRRV